MSTKEETGEAKLAALRAALDEGLASGVYEGDAFAELRAELHGKDTDAWQSLPILLNCD